MTLKFRSKRHRLGVESLETRLNLSTLGGLGSAIPEFQQSRLATMTQRNPSTAVKSLRVSLSSSSRASSGVDYTSLSGDTSLSSTGTTSIPVLSYSSLSGAGVEQQNGTPNIAYMSSGGVSINYQVNASAGGSYQLNFGVASVRAGAFNVYVNGSLAAQYSVPNTGSWSSFNTVSQNISLNAGSNSIQIVPQNGIQFNINSISTSPTGAASSTTSASPTVSTTGNVLPVGPWGTTISADLYSAIYNSRAENIVGAPDIGYVSPSGAYVEYTLSVQNAGWYNLSVYASSASTGTFNLAVNGQQAASFTTSTGAWNKFQLLSNSVYLPAGTATLRYSSTNGTQYNLGTQYLTPQSQAATTTTQVTQAVTQTPTTPTYSAPATTASPVSINSQWMTSFNQLNITGTSGNDSIYLAQSGNTLYVTANGQTTSYNTSDYGDIQIKGGDGNDTITVDSSVTMNARLYGEAGNDVLTNKTQGKGTIVAIGGGYDVLTGNGWNTSLWADSSDSINATGEWSGGHVHQVSGFYGGVSTELQGQNLSDPAGTGATTRLTSSSLWGTGPTVADVNQGQVADCFLLGAVQSMAYASPDKLRETAVDLGDGTYAIQFQRGGTTTYVRVDGELPSNGYYANGLMYAHPGTSGNQWAAILEKGYAEFGTGQWSYSSLNDGNFNVALGAFGQYVNSVPNWDVNTMFNAIQNGVNAGKGVTIGTYAGVNAGAPLIGWHTYTVTSAWRDAWGNGYLNLRNPWGYDGAGSDSNPNDATVTVTASQLLANLQYGSIFA